MLQNKINKYINTSVCQYDPEVYPIYAAGNVRVVVVDIVDVLYLNLRAQDVEITGCCFFKTHV